MAYSNSAVLPIPGGPTSERTALCPPRTVARSRSRTSRSLRRSTNRLADPDVTIRYQRVRGREPVRSSRKATRPRVLVIRSPLLAARIVLIHDRSVHEVGFTAAIEEPTLASVWQAVAGSAISDQLLEWPPDLFPLTDVILE